MSDDVDSTRPAHDAASGHNGPRALRWILPALVVSSGLGYGVQLVAPALLSSPDYVQFSAFWSALFLGVAALSGVQNEVARSATGDGANGATRAGTLRSYSAVIGAGAALVGGAMGTALGLVHGSSELLAFAVLGALGLLSFALLAVIVGLLYGAHRWTAVTVAIIADPLLRALGFLALGALVVTAWMPAVPLRVLLFVTVVPFTFAVVWVWLAGGRAASRAVSISGSWKGLLGRSFHTIVAACALGFMASGQPLMVSAVGKGEDPALVAGTILVIVLVRAPLVSPIIALQSYLTVTFRDAPASMVRRVSVFSGAVLVVSGLVAIAVALWAPPIVAALLPQYTLPSSLVLVASVLGAGLVGVQCIVGAGLLGAGRHRLYAGGWLVTAAFVIVAAVLPLPFEARLSVMLLVPALFGLAVHGVGVARIRTRQPVTV